MLDESSSFKNAQSKRFKALKLVRPRIRPAGGADRHPSPTGWRICGPRCTCWTAAPGWARPFPATGRRFSPEDRAYPGQQYRTYSPQDGPTAVSGRPSPTSCVSMKAEDYLTLPDYTEDIVPVVLDAKAKRAYDKLERDMLLQVDEATITAQSAAVLNGKLLQLCSGRSMTRDGQAVEIHACKLTLFWRRWNSSTGSTPWCSTGSSMSGPAGGGVEGLWPAGTGISRGRGRAGVERWTG